MLNLLSVERGAANNLRGSNTRMLSPAVRVLPATCGCCPLCGCFLLCVCCPLCVCYLLCVCCLLPALCVPAPAVRCVFLSCVCGPPTPVV